MHTYIQVPGCPPTMIHTHTHTHRVHDRKHAFYLVLLGLDKQFGCGDARLVWRDLVLGGKKTMPPPLQWEFTQAATNCLSLPDNGTIQFKGKKHSTTTWLLIKANVSAGWVQINLHLKIRVITAVPLGFLSHIIPPDYSYHFCSAFECKLRNHLFGVI